MKGIGGTTVIKALHAPGRACLGTGGFRPNAASDPSSTYFRGSLKGLYTVAYAATGLYTVTFDAGFEFPQKPLIVLAETMVDVTNTNRFRAVKKGDWNNTTRQFVIASLQESAAFAIPSDADNWIDFFIFGRE